MVQVFHKYHFFGCFLTEKFIQHHTGYQNFEAAGAKLFFSRTLMCSKGWPGGFFGRRILEGGPSTDGTPQKKAPADDRRGN
jgi:hypothetical protein